MKAKEKARELVNKFKGYAYDWLELSDLTDSKECALICVDEIIIDYTSLTDDNSSWEGYKMSVLLRIDFWQEVKNEINKL